MSPRHIDSSHEGCLAVREVLNRVGEKWSVPLVGLLGDRPMRFNELKRAIEGVSQRMLTLTLRGLERDGLLTRTVFPTVPPRVDYALTPLGRSLLEPVSALGQWAIKHKRQIAEAQQRYDAPVLPTLPIYARRAISGLRPK